MLLPCISTTKMFWWIFVLQFTYTGMGNEIFLMHIKIIFVMDARVNVNIDVFVLDFFWTDLQGEKKIL